LQDGLRIRRDLLHVGLTAPKRFNSFDGLVLLLGGFPLAVRDFFSRHVVCVILIRAARTEVFQGNNLASEGFAVLYKDGLCRPKLHHDIGLPVGQCHEGTLM
jgi:hypothetical protein